MSALVFQAINGDAFRDLKILVELDLSNNEITELSPSTFSGNERLQTLTLSHNSISQLAAFQFPVLKHIKTIDLSYNSLHYIDVQAFGNLGSSLESIYIHNNHLKSVREAVFINLANLKSLQLHHNPWNCDCKLKQFRDWVVAKGLYTYPTACGEPERLADKYWQDVAPDDYACKPEIRVPQAVVFSQPGANVTLGCFIVGNPLPDAKWVLKGRIVNNNTIPVGVTSSPSSVIPPSPTPIHATVGGGALDVGRGSLQAENVSTGEFAHRVPTQFLIHEEGGLERWFNLTIVNVGLESVADYTCVAVNAGGVMEENISLTFEEPEPVGLPGGKKEEDSLAMIIGAAAGGILFVLVLLLVLCCCCCQRKTKRASPNSSTPSSHSSASNIMTTPERHGSVIGYAESNHKLLHPGQQPNMGSDHHPHHHHHHPDQQRIMYDRHRGGGYTSHQNVEVNRQKHPRAMEYQGIPQNDVELVQQQNSQEGSNLVYEGGVRSRQPYVQGVSGGHSSIAAVSGNPPKQVMVNVNEDGGAPGSGAQNFRSSVASEQELVAQFPDLIQQQHQAASAGVRSPPSKKPPGSGGGQPLNPAALVVPPSPPLQFPHQFPHLIHSSRLPTQQTGHQQSNKPAPPPPPARSISFGSGDASGTSGGVGAPGGQAPPLISPPAQFNTPASSATEPSLSTAAAGSARGYVTLPRRLHESVSAPIYDGVGPRTSATGAINAAGVNPPPPNSSIQPPCACPAAAAPPPPNTSQYRTSSLRRQPTGAKPLSLEPPLCAGGSGSKRDSSGSEVTMGDESMSGYFEPFGKAIPAPHLLPPFARDSIASTESDLEAILAANTAKGQGCPLHKTHPKLNHASTKASGHHQQPKQLKGILKGGSSGGANHQLSSQGKITTNPVATATSTTVVVKKSANGGASSAVGKSSLGPNSGTAGGANQRSHHPSSSHHQSNSGSSGGKNVVVEALDV